MQQISPWLAHAVLSYKVGCRDLDRCIARDDKFG